MITQKMTEEKPDFYVILITILCCRTWNLASNEAHTHIAPGALRLMVKTTQKSSLH